MLHHIFHTVPKFPHDVRYFSLTSAMLAFLTFCKAQTTQTTKNTKKDIPNRRPVAPISLLLKKNKICAKWVLKITTPSLQGFLAISFGQSPVTAVLLQKELLLLITFAFKYIEEPFPAVAPSKPAFPLWKVFVKQQSVRRQQMYEICQISIPFCYLMNLSHHRCKCH